MFNLRRKQVEEILDEDQRINRRVYDKEKEQARVFNEVTKPKSDRDIGAEVDIDRAVEKFNSLLEKKLIDIDILFKYPANDARYKEAQKEILSTGSVVIAYNDLARLAIRPDLANATKEAIKSKITEIQNSIDAVVYGLGELVKLWSGQGINQQDFSRKGYPLLSVYILFKTIQKQLFKGSIVPLTTPELENSMREWRASLEASARPEVRNFLGRIQNTERGADLAVRPTVIRAKEDAVRRRANVLKAEKGAPLSEDELTYLRNSIFGVGESPMIDPVLRDELDRMARIETLAKTEIGKRVATTESAPAPLPTAYYGVANPEYSDAIARSIVERNRTALETSEKELSDALAKYAPSAGGIYQAVPDGVVTDDVATLSDRLLQAQIALAEIEGVDYDPDELEQAIMAKYANLFDENPRDTVAHSRRFNTQIRALAKELLNIQARVIEKEQEEEIKASKERVRTVGEGSARSKSGKLGIEYDDTKNDAYTRY